MKTAISCCLLFLFAGSANATPIYQLRSENHYLWDSTTYWYNEPPEILGRLINGEPGRQYESTLVLADLGGTSQGGLFDLAPIAATNEEVTHFTFDWPAGMGEFLVGIDTLTSQLVFL